MLQMHCPSCGGDVSRAANQCAGCARPLTDGTMAIIEAMKKANSTDPAKFTPEMFNISFTGATGKVEFDAKGDRKDAEMTIFRMGKDGKIQPVAIVKNGVSTPFKADAAAAPAAAAPANAPAAAPTEMKKEEKKK